MKKSIVLFLVTIIIFKPFSNAQTKNAHLFNDTSKEALNNQLREFFWNIIKKGELKETYIGQTNIRFKLDGDLNPIKVECSFGTPEEVQRAIYSFFDSIVNRNCFLYKTYRLNNNNWFFLLSFKYHLFTPGKPHLLSPEEMMQYECMTRFKSDFTEEEIHNGFPDCTIPLTGCILLQPARFDNSPRKKPQVPGPGDPYNIKAKLRIVKEKKEGKL